METTRGTAIVLAACALTFVFCLWAAFEIGKRGAGLLGSIDAAPAESRSQTSPEGRDSAASNAAADAQADEGAPPPGLARRGEESARGPASNEKDSKARRGERGGINRPRTRRRGGEPREERHHHSHTAPPRTVPLDRLRTRLREFLRRAPIDHDRRHRFGILGDRERTDQPARDCFGFGCEHHGDYDVFGRR